MTAYRKNKNIILSHEIKKNGEGKPYVISYVIFKK